MAGERPTSAAYDVGSDTKPARLRPGVVVAQEVRGLTGEQMVAAHAFVELHTLRPSGFCTCGFRVPLFGYRDHLEAEANG